MCLTVMPRHGCPHRRQLWTRKNQWSRRLTVGDHTSCDPLCIPPIRAPCLLPDSHGFRGPCGCFEVAMKVQTGIAEGQLADVHPPEWHEKRRQGIGGSDWPAVLTLPPYGCARQLWHTKRNDQPDYPREQTGAMLRGHRLEQHVADELQALIGRTVRRPGRLARVAMPEWWIGNPDRMAVAVDGAGPAVVECKTVNPGRYRSVVYDGCPEAWILQVQHYMGLTGWQNAIIAALEPVDWQLHVIDVPRDDEMIATMVDAGTRFWRQVENGPVPDQLDAKDKRCQRCEFRLTCQGEALFGAIPADAGDLEEVTDVVLEGLVEQRQEIAEIAAEAKTALDGINTRIKTHLGKPRKVSIPGCRVYLTEVVSNRLETARLRREKPDIAKAYTKQSKSTRLAIYAS